MGIKIHGIPHSGATLRVLAAAEEKELDFELVPVDLKSGAHKQQPFLSLNVSCAHLICYISQLSKIQRTTCMVDDTLSFHFNCYTYSSRISMQNF